jgi:hypothetical protein
VIAFLRRRRDGLGATTVSHDPRPLAIKTLIGELQRHEPGWACDLSGTGSTLRVAGFLQKDRYCLQVVWKASDEHRIRLSVDPTSAAGAASWVDAAVLKQLWGADHTCLFRYCTWRHLDYVRLWAKRVPEVLKSQAAPIRSSLRARLP